MKKQIDPFCNNNQKRNRIVYYNLENELGLDLETVNIGDLMLEVNKDGSLDIGFRTDSEDGVADVDDLSQEVHMEIWSEMLCEDLLTCDSFYPTNQLYLKSDRQTKTYTFPLINFLTHRND